MRASTFATALTAIATQYKTVYAWGMFGSRITKKSVAVKAKQYPKWYDGRRLYSVFEPLYNLDTPVYGFDCIGLIKAVLWGWNEATGAKYASCGVPDVSADSMIGKCSEVSSDFSNISIGEFVWMSGHCGVYVGDGKVVESTPIWKNGVQIAALSARKWLKHGKLPWVSYDIEEVNTVRIELPVLAKGSKVAAVKTLQRLLCSYGHKGKDNKTLTFDGEFGTNTDHALRAFQKATRLEVDGICGKESWNRLLCVKEE